VTGCLVTSRGSSRGSLHRSSSTTPPSAGSSSTTSPPPRVQVPRHVARLVARIIVRLVVDYLAYDACLGASARRTAHRLSSITSPTPRDRVPRHIARLVAWLAAPLVVDYSASRRLVVDNFVSAARPGASACRAARRVARCAACRRLLHLRRATGCLGTSRSSSRGSSRGSLHLSSSTTPPSAGSSLTTSPPPCVRVPWHVARLVTRIITRPVVDYVA
jgi:hypothetical protein